MDTTADPTASTLMVVRVWLPDRPGALGLVASRIGALGADIVGVDVLERSDTVAVDEFAVSLPRADLELVRLLVREIEQVDGASVEEWRTVQRFPDPRLDVLETVESVAAARDVPDLVARLVAGVRVEFDADWAAVLRDGEVTAAAGDGAPSPGALVALAAGTIASPMVADGHAGPDDLAVAPLPTHDATLLAGRDGHPFRRRERQQLLALARVADRVAVLLASR
ncbi:MAG TPA: hypothetical protein VFZ83_07900 [Acidimicrobiia bacterium]|nr:hypothetical protein [Acidimicrobiia bacterium]